MDEFDLMDTGSIADRLLPRADVCAFVIIGGSPDAAKVVKDADKIPTMTYARMVDESRETREKAMRVIKAAFENQVAMFHAAFGEYPKCLRGETDE